MLLSLLLAHLQSHKVQIELTLDLHGQYVKVCRRSDQQAKVDKVAEALGRSLLRSEAFALPSC